MKVSSRTVPALIVITSLFTACSVTGRLNRRQVVPELTHVVHEEPTPRRDTSTKSYTADFYMGHYEIDETGEKIETIDIEPIVVVSTSRTLPERLGHIMIDFVVTLPTKLLGDARSITITPMLHTPDKDYPLQSLVLRGTLVEKVQMRQYWQYDRYLKVFRPDSIQAAKAQERFIRFPYPEGVRLDSVVVSTHNVSYHYRQEVPAMGAGKSLQITLEGNVTGADGSCYTLPPSDTLSYYVSSLVSFVDTTPRYMEKIVTKYATATISASLTFKAGSSRIDTSESNNAKQLRHLRAFMDKILQRNEFVPDSIILTAACSPEGTYTLNAALARSRAESILSLLMEEYPIDRLDTLIMTNHVPENWAYLENLVSGDRSLENSREVTVLCNTIPDPDKRERLIRLKYPNDYRIIRRKLYPLLRTVELRCYLHRPNMVQDTIRTDVPDTLYSEGVMFLQNKQYAEALNILSPYKDRNTAIALLSIGYDRPALEILLQLSEDAANLYLTAVAYSRLGEIDRAKEWFDRACELEPNYKYRGSLDPEISSLIP